MFFKSSYSPWCLIGWLLTCLLPICAPLSAQVAMNDDLYQQYRERMRAEFILVDSIKGGGIPAEKIDPAYKYGDVRLPYWMQSDGTIHTGFYLAMLATEYRRFAALGYPTSPTVEELYFALNALWRLDYHSNYYAYDACIGCKGPASPDASCPDSIKCSLPNCYVCHTCPDNPNFNLSKPNLSNHMDAVTFQSPDLDGFMIRSDAPCGFQEELKQMNPQLFDTALVSSDMLTPSSNSGTNKEMSQDQAIFTLMGLYAVSTCLDSNVVYNGVLLRQFAREQANRIVLRLKGSGNWVLVNPATKSPSKRGSSGFGYAFANAKAGKAIVGGHPKYLNWLSILEWLPWQVQQFPAVTGRRVNAAMDAALSSTGDSWSFFGINTTRQGLVRYALGKTEMEVYLLLYAYMHHKQHSVHPRLKKIYQEMLAKVPAQGPSSPWPDGSTVYNVWNTHNRFIGGRFEKITLNRDECSQFNLKSLLDFEVDGVHYSIDCDCQPSPDFNQQSAIRIVKKSRKKGVVESVEVEIDKFIMGEYNSQGQRYSGIDVALLYNLYYLAEKESIFKP